MNLKKLLLIELAEKSLNAFKFFIKRNNGLADNYAFHALGMLQAYVRVLYIVYHYNFVYDLDYNKVKPNE